MKPILIVQTHFVLSNRNAENIFEFPQLELVFAEPHDAVAFQRFFLLRLTTQHDLDRARVHLLKPFGEFLKSIGELLVVQTRGWPVRRALALEAP